MRLLEDGLIAALSAVGLVTLLYLPLSALLYRRRRIGAAAVLPCRGTGAELEQDVRQLRRETVCRRIVLLDCGMEAEARQIAALLCRDGGAVCVCAEEELTAELEALL